MTHNKPELKANEVSAELQSFTIRRPDDFHIHLRDNQSMSLLVGHVCSQFARALVMPNLKPPVVNAKQAKLYQERIMRHVPKNISFNPLMTLYLTDSTTPMDIRDAKNSKIISAVKYYPRGATTNSENGVTDIMKLKDTLHMMQECDIPLCIHGEVTHSNVDVFDREAFFLKNELPSIIEMCPKLKIILEHISTKEAVQFVLNADDNIAGSITAHHLLSNRNEIFSGGITPHMYCLPIIKTEEDRLALVSAAISGNCKFFAGTDSAPHERSTKETCNGKAGIYTAYSALSLYAQVFDDNNSLAKLEAFVSEYGARFYGLSLNEGKVILMKKPNLIPQSFEYLGGKLIPYRAGKSLKWSVIHTMQNMQGRKYKL